MSPTTQTYINRIRNNAKRAYAQRYWRYLESDAQGIYVHEPEHTGLGSMAAQAVRMNLVQLRRHYG